MRIASQSGVTREGSATNVLDSPLNALGFLVDEISRFPFCAPVSAGEIVTTGTLTEALPVAPGETWTMAFEGFDFAPMELSFQ